MALLSTGAVRNAGPTRSNYCQRSGMYGPALLATSAAGRGEVRVSWTAPLSITSPGQSLVNRDNKVSGEMVHQAFENRG